MSSVYNFLSDSNGGDACGLGNGSPGYVGSSGLTLVSAILSDAALSAAFCFRLRRKYHRAAPTSPRTATPAMAAPAMAPVLTVLAFAEAGWLESVELVT